MLNTKYTTETPEQLKFDNYHSDSIKQIIPIDPHEPKT